MTETLLQFERTILSKDPAPSKLELFEMWLEGALPTWDEYIFMLDTLYPMDAAEYQRRLAMQWTPSLLLGCEP